MDEKRREDFLVDLNKSKNLLSSAFFDLLLDVANTLPTRFTKNWKDLRTFLENLLNMKVSSHQAGMELKNLFWSLNSEQLSKLQELCGMSPRDIEQKRKSSEW
jgi:hypothetical protein